MLAAAVSVAAPSSAPTSHSPAADTIASLLSSMLSSVSLSLRTSPWLYSSLPSRCRPPTGLRAAIGDGAVSHLPFGLVWPAAEVPEKYIRYFPPPAVRPHPKLRPRPALALPSLPRRVRALQTRRFRGRGRAATESPPRTTSVPPSIPSHLIRHAQAAVPFLLYTAADVVHIADHDVSHHAVLARGEDGGTVAPQLCTRRRQ